MLLFFRYKYNTNEIKEISGSEIEKSRFVDESKILKSSFVSGSNMTQLKRKSDLESLTVNILILTTSCYIIQY